MSRHVPLLTSLAAAVALVLLGGLVTQVSRPPAPEAPVTQTAEPPPEPSPGDDRVAALEARERAYRARLEEANRRLTEQGAALEEARRRLRRDARRSAPRRFEHEHEDEHEEREHASRRFAYAGHFREHDDD